MLMIRLQRIGKKKQPTYRLVISEKTKDTQGDSLEILGHYNPLSKDKTLELKEDRIKHWLDKGAQASNTVHNLLIKAGIVTGKKKKSVVITNKRQAKMDGKKAEVEEKVATPAEAPAETSEDKPVEATVEEKPVEEAPKEEVKEEPKAEEKVEEPKPEEKPAEEEKKEEASVEEKPKEE